MIDTMTLSRKMYLIINLYSYSLDDLKTLGREKNICPYFLARQMLLYCDIVVFNYQVFNNINQYLLDSKVASLISSDLEKECIVVFDEAHNIDSVCIESLSVALDIKTIKNAEKQIKMLNDKIKDCEESKAEKLKSEYLKLVNELNSDDNSNNDNVNGGEESLGVPVITNEILSEIVPGNIRKAKHFIDMLDMIISYIKDKICNSIVCEMETPLAFRLSLLEVYFKNNLIQNTGIDEKILRACSTRLSSLLLTLEATDYDEYYDLNKIADFCTLVGTYLKGFMIIKEAYNPYSKNNEIIDPIYQLCCLDASISIKHVFEYFQSVIITSGTLSPIEFYPKILDFQPKVVECFEMTINRKCLCPLVITKGSDMNLISTKYDERHDTSIVRNYADLLLRLSQTIPDGIIWFFPSYDYMEWMIGQWYNMDLLSAVMKYKLIFIETKDVVETSLALNNYRRACDSGRGGIFLSIARGKVAEGVNFDSHYGRCVVICGIPFLSSESKPLEARENYLRSEHNISENEFYTFDAMRQVFIIILNRQHNVQVE